MMKKMNFKRLFLLPVLALITIVSVVGCGKDSFTDQGEVGSYISLLDGKNYNLTLDKNVATLTIGATVVNGAYTFDGTSLVIAFEGEANETNVKFENNLVTFDFKGTTYTLYRDVLFTVSYVTNGGSSVLSQKVQNGVAGVEPENPVKENERFLGWYADEQLTVKYDFNKAVTCDTVLYAKFGQATDAFAEFTVTYVDGAQTTSTDVTYNQKVIALPKVDDANFVGWWASDNENASKLTKQVTENTVIDENTTLYAVYASNAPLVSITNGKISWDSKGVGKQYAVNIRYADDLEADVVYSRRVSTTSVDFDFATLNAAEYVVEVTCGDYTGKAYINNKQLATVSNFKVEGNTLTWNAVEGATGYEVQVLCGNATHNHVGEVGAVTSYNFGTCTMGKNGVNFVVTAKASDALTSTSKTYNVLRQLDKVENVKINANQEVTWDAVKDAEAYKVAVLQDGKLNEYTVKTTSFALDKFYGELNITITPVLAGYYAEKVEKAYTKTILATPSNVKLNGYQLTFDAVAGAVEYKVVVGDKTYTVKDTTYILTEEDIASADAIKVTVQAVAKDANNNSKVSNAVEFDKNGINVINYSAGVITWQAIPGVDSYLVKVDDGKAIAIEGSELELPIESGAHTIYIAAQDNDGNPVKWFYADVTIYALIFDMNGAGEVDPISFVKGDKLFGLETPYRPGYNFTGWKNTDGSEFTKTVFDADQDITVVATWEGKEYKVTLDYQTYGEGEQKTAELTFGDAFNLSVPTSKNNLKAFAGWFTQPNANGDRYTNENGESIKNFRELTNCTLYAGWVDVFTFELINSDKEYSVKKGPGISYVTELKIPATYNGKKVTTIESAGFASCSNIVVVNIPNSIQNVEIGSEGPNASSSCFYSCSKLTAVNVYEVEGVKEEDVKYLSIDGVLIYKNEFNGVEIKYVPYYTKAGIYTIPSIVTTIPTNAFKSCSKLEEIIVPASVTQIDEGAFTSCSKLTKITFLTAEDGTTEKELKLGPKTFASCTALEEVILPARLANIAVDAFTSSSKILNVHVVGTYAKQAYASIDGVLVTADKTEIVYYPKAREDAYTTPVGVTKIGESAFASAKLSAITISGQVTEIGKEAFKSCTALTSITFTGDETDARLTIRESAFYGCTNAALTEIVLPANLLKLEKNAFGNTSKLTKVTVLSVDPNIDFATAAFGTTAATPTFYVTTLVLGEKVSVLEFVGVFGQKLADVSVDEKNENYTSLEGVLYNKDVTKVIYFPNGREGSYTLPQTVTEIGDRVFQGKTEINSITITKNVTRIGESAFQSCTKLAEVIFEGDRTQDLVIEKAAFKSCSMLTNVTLPEKLVSIGEETFRSCSKLETITFPSTVKTIGEYAFGNCSALTHVDLPAELELIEEKEGTSTYDKALRTRAFDSCSSLEGFSISETNKNYATIDGILYKKIYKEDVFDSYELILCPAGKSGRIEIDVDISKIGSHSFYYNQKATDVIFADAKEGRTIEMGDYIFYYCKNIHTIRLPKGIKSLETYTAYSCDYLKSIVIPNTVESIKSKALYYCPELTVITFEEGGTAPLRIEDGTHEADNYGGSYYYGPFYSCGSIANGGIKEIVLPERTTYIGKYTFGVGSVSQGGSATIYSTPTLTRVVIPNSVEEIGEYAFYKQSNLKELEIDAENSKLSKVGQYVFAYSGLTSFNFPKRLTAMSNDMLYQCKGITSITIPSCVTDIPTYALAYTNLETITFEAGSNLKTIGTYAFTQTKLTTIELPQSIEVIGDYAFSTIPTLTQITFAGSDTEAGSSLKQIGYYAFTKTGLTSFAFPYCGVNSSGAYNTILLKNTGTGTSTNVHLFSGCKDLTSLYISEAVTSINNLFAGCSSIKKITVAEGNANFTVDEVAPILLSKDGTEIQLIFGRADGNFVIPNGVTKIGDYAFQGQTDIKQIIIPESVKTIGNYAFFNCNQLEKVEFAPGSLCDSIGTYAFANCRNLKSINLPSDLKTTGTYAFANCSSLETIRFPEGFKTVANYSFLGCESLKTIIFSSTVETIGSYSFAFCSGLTELTIPASITKTDTFAFQYCTGLKKVTIPATLTTINNRCFEFCSSLEEATFEEGCKIVSGYMFKDCTSLKTINLPSTIKTISNYAFQNCTSLTSFTIPATIAYFGGTNTTAAGTTAITISTSGYVFAGCTNLSSVTFESGSQIKILATHMFDGCTALKEITLPTGLTSIGDAAFTNSGLTSIVIPDTVTQIGNSATTRTATATTLYGAFEGCEDLTSVTLNSKLTKLMSYTFYGCKALKNITLPASLTTIHTNCFAESGLESIVINNKFTAATTSATTAGIGSYAFANCTSLKTVTFGSGSTVLGTYMFDGCSALENVTLPTTLTNLNTYAFRNCTSLGDVALPATLTSIGTYAFYNTAVTTAEIPAKVTTLGNFAYAECANLVKVTLPNTLKTLGSTTAGSTFANCTNLASVTLGNAMTTIGHNVFLNCESLTKLDLPATLTTIGREAFAGSSIKSLSVGAKVTTIYGGAFNGMPNLDSVTIDSGNTKYAVYENMAVIAISNNQIISVFHDNENADFVLPETVSSIYNYALAGVKFKSVTLSEAFTTVSSYAFHSSLIEKVILPKHDITIGTYAFQNSALKELVNSENITTIGNAAFAGSELVSIEFSDKLTAIGTGTSASTSTTLYGAFENCVNLKKVVLGNGVQKIMSCSFYGCTSLTSIVIPESVNTISVSAFRGSGLTKVEIPESVTTMGTYAFADCNNLIQATISNAVMGNYEFLNCKALTKVTFDGAMENIATYSFQGCSALNDVTLNSELTVINTHAFEFCSSLKNITIPENVTTIQTNAFAESGLVSITVPGSVINIFGEAFARCVDLKTVVLSEGLQTLGLVNTTPGTVNTTGKVFTGCVNLETINLPESLAQIGSETFKDCTKIKSIIIPANCMYVGGEAFGNWTKDQTVYICNDIFDITGQWCEMVTSSVTGRTAYWKNTEATFVWNYEAK